MRGLLAFSPIIAMLLLLVGLSIYSGGVSNAPLLLIFVLAAMVAVVSLRGMKFSERVAIFSQGAGSKDLLLMVWIFMLAGSFAASAKDMGAAGAMVDLTLQFLPARFALAGLFIAACLTSLCMGTSVGTIVALMPIASGMAERTEMTVPMVVAAVVGGAFFGDILSFISDTTIVATQSQGCRLSDKFRFNLKNGAADCDCGVCDVPVYRQQCCSCAGCRSGCGVVESGALSGSAGVCRVWHACADCADYRQSADLCHGTDRWQF